MEFQNKNLNTLRKGISIPILLIMFLCEFCSNEVIFLALGGLAGVYFAQNKGLHTEMPGFWLYVFMLACGFVMGLLHLEDTGYNFYAYIKHVYYVLFPFLVWYVGENIAKKNNLSKELVYRTIVVATVFFCIWDVSNFTNSIMSLDEFSNDSSKIYQFRSRAGYSNYYSVISLYILLCFRHELNFGKFFSWSILGICMLTSLIQFSRTTLLVALIYAVAMFFWIFQKCRKKIRFGYVIGVSLMLMLLGVLVASLFPDITREFVAKVKNSAWEMSPFHEEWDWYTINNAWRGYEVYCALVRFMNADFLEKLLGGGFGATLDVFGFAYLVTTEESLPFLHNGYFTQLMVFGVVGLTAIVGWFASVCKAALALNNVNDRIFVLGLVACVVCMTAIVGGPLFSPSVAQLMLPIALVMFAQKKEYKLENNVNFV